MHVAIEKGNTDIVRLLLSCPQIDVTIKCILNQYFLNKIQNDIFKYNSKLNVFISFQKNNYFMKSESIFLDVIFIFFICMIFLKVVF